MSNNYIYNESEPLAEKSAYEPYETVDFKMNFLGQALVPNSVRLMGDIVLLKNGAEVAGADKGKRVMIDNLIGAHSFIDSAIVHTLNQSTIESVKNYARYVKMTSSGTLMRDDMFASDKVAELRTHLPSATVNMLYGVYDKYNDKVEECNFFMMPDICLNNVVGNAISYSKTGEITVSIRLARINSVLFGDDMDATYSYVLKNFKLAYNTIPDSPDYAGNVIMRVKDSIRPTINSSHSIIHVTTPIVCDRVLMSFINSSNDNALVPNSLRLESLPDVSRVEYHYNDNTNGLVSYDIDSEQELLHYTQEAFKSAGKNSFSLGKLENNKGYCIGFTFGYQQLVNSRISIAINSSLSTDYVAYVYLSGQMTI